MNKKIAQSLSDFLHVYRDWYINQVYAIQDKFIIAKAFFNYFHSLLVLILIMQTVIGTGNLETIQLSSFGT